LIQAQIFGCGSKNIDAYFDALIVEVH